MRRPYWSNSRKRWYVRVGSTQVNLGPDKDEAMKKWHQMMAGHIDASPDVTVLEVIEQFLDWSQAHQAESTYKLYRWWLKSFAEYVGAMKLRDLKPYHVTRWLDRGKWTGTTGNGAVRAVVRPFSWAHKMGVIKENPLVGVERPSASARECYLTREDRQRILKATQGEFRDFVEFLMETGCRPQEARKIEARHVNRQDGVVVFPRSESKGGKKARVITLTPKALAIVQRLMLKHPQGPIFRNSKGRPWKSDAINNRFQRLSDKLKLECHAYAFRHSFCTDALTNGVDPITVAELMGHTSLKMIQEVYNKIRMRADHMKKAAIQAVS